jgi:ABC-type phosphate transport system substrate-binding protein
MKELIEKHLTAILLLIILLSIVGIFMSSLVQANPVLIENVTSAKLSESEIRAVFTLRVTRFSNGIPIKVFILPQDSLTTHDFAYYYLGISPTEWFDLLAIQETSGRTNLHTVVESDSEMISKVSHTINSVGYTNDFMIMNNEDGIYTVAKQQVSYRARK